VTIIRFFVAWFFGYLCAALVLLAVTAPFLGERIDVVLPAAIFFGLPFAFWFMKLDGTSRMKAQAAREVALEREKERLRALK